jgi:hypothetical protein
MISASSLPLTIAPTYYQHVDPGYYEPVTGHGGGGTTAFFHLPFSDATVISGPQHHVRTTGNQLFIGIGRSTQHHYELYHSANANGGGGATFPSSHLDDEIGTHYAPHHAHAPPRSKSTASSVTRYDLSASVTAATTSLLSVAAVGCRSL